MVRKKAKIINNPDLEKDLTTGVIINTNKSTLLNRKMVKKNLSLQQEETDKYKTMYEDVSARMAELESKLELLIK